MKILCNNKICYHESRKNTKIFYLEKKALEPDAASSQSVFCIFSERSMKGNIMYKLRVARMPNQRWVKKVHKDGGRFSKWTKSCKRLVRKCGLNCREDMFGRGHVAGWNVVCMSGDGSNWNERFWKKIVVEKVHEFGLNKWKKGMKSKKTLKWYQMKEAQITIRVAGVVNCYLKKGVRLWK